MQNSLVENNFSFANLFIFARDFFFKLLLFVKNLISRKQKKNLIYKNILRIQIHGKLTIEHNSQTLQQFYIERNNSSQRYRYIV